MLRAAVLSARIATTVRMPRSEPSEGVFVFSPFAAYRRPIVLGIHLLAVLLANYGALIISGKES
ncbi:MAG: hypothetical protein C4293_15520 [Nitrospiraceae bacterium]